MDKQKQEQEQEQSERFYYSLPNPPGVVNGAYDLVSSFINPLLIHNPEMFSTMSFFLATFETVGSSLDLSIYSKLLERDDGLR